ncbi:MAG: signal peptidase II [Clostridiales bacterium]|jgi:signal peptidase II|nr:signal peptidase II [Clostridiales bacterium]
MFWYVIGIVLNLILVGFDRLTKVFASKIPYGDSIDVIPGVFEITHIRNTGAAFSILQGGRWFFIVVTILILGVIIFYYIKMPKERFDTIRKISLILISAGAIGNLIDRLFFGYVVDFLYFSLINFPVFNLADAYDVVGTIIFIVITLFFSGEKKVKESYETDEAGEREID